MKKTAKKTIAFLLAVIMCVSLVSGLAFADEKETINYVAFGDSMTQGYCFTDYNENSAEGHYCGWKGISERSYIKMFANTLQEKNPDATVNLIDMTIQGLQPDELYAFLKPETFDFDSMTRGARKHIGWWTGDYHTDEEQSPGADGEGAHHIFDTFAEMSDAYIQAVKDADIITFDIGENYFGTYLNDRRDENEIVTELIEDSPVLKSIADAMYAKITDTIKQYAPDFASNRIDGILYAYMSYIVYCEKALGAIYELNPDVQVILVPLSNPHQELYFEFNGIKVPYSEIINVMMDSLNLYMKDACIYHDRYTIAYLDEPVMSFADELYFLPEGELSQDAQILLERTVLGTGSILGQTLVPAPAGFAELYESWYNGVYAEYSYYVSLGLMSQEEFEEAFYGTVGTIGYFLCLEFGDDFLPIKGVAAVDKNGQMYVEPKEDGDYYIIWNVIDRIIYEEIAAKYGEERAFNDFFGNIFESMGDFTLQTDWDPCVAQVCGDAHGEKPGPKILTKTLADARAAVADDTAMQWQADLVEAVGDKLDNWTEICCNAAQHRVFPDISMNVGNFGQEDVIRILTQPETITESDYLALHAAIRNGSAARGFGAHPCPYGHVVKYNAVVKAYDEMEVGSAETPISRIPGLLSFASDINSKLMSFTHSLIAKIKSIAIELFSWNNIVERFYQDLPFSFKAR